MTGNMYIPSPSTPSTCVALDVMLSRLSSCTLFCVLGMDWGPDGGMGRWSCSDGKSIGPWARNICSCSSHLHKDTFQITLPTVVKDAVAELMTVSLLLLHKVSPYWWGQPSPATCRYLDTAGGNQPSR